MLLTTLWEERLLRKVTGGDVSAMLMRSSTESVRNQNCVLVLTALRRNGPLSHTDLADLTGLSSATVSAVTADLERESILERIENSSASGRGRPRVSFMQRRNGGYIVTVRISSDQVQYSLVDYSGTLIDRFEEMRSGTKETVESFIENLRQAVDRLAERSIVARNRILVVSISSKGLVDGFSKTMLWSPVFGSEKIDFSKVFASLPQATIILNNETLLVAAAIARRQEKKGQFTSHSLAALSLGHSIGLGIVHRREANGQHVVTAPDFGHMLHMANGGLCRCGNFGCIEASAGFYAILRAAFEVPADTIPAKFVPLAEMDRIAASARQGNRMAEYAFRQAGLALGNGLSRMISLNEMMPVVVTGPGTRFFDLMHRGLKEGLGQSRLARMGGMPDISVILDEQVLVFEGHLDLALSRIDHDIVVSRHRIDTEF
jgi:predicted NBD/HSP70 family sugar kinase